MSKQQQFLDVVDRDEAERRFQAAISLQPLGTESIALDECRGRILAEDIIATVDVPSFDRSNYDGFAVRANDTVGATEERPVTLQLLDAEIAAGVVPDGSMSAGSATARQTSPARNLRWSPVSRHSSRSPYVCAQPPERTPSVPQAPPP